MKSILLCLLLIIVAWSHAAQYYEWTDERGVKQYTQQPPPPNVKQVQQKRSGSNVIETSGPGYAMQQAAKSFPVTLYANACEPCKSARAHLQKRGIPFTEKNPEQKEETEGFRKLSGGNMEVPLLTVGSLKPLAGYSRDSWDAVLDQAGYPK